MHEPNNPYLQQEVFSASPMRLRWMLLQRAEELCGEVARLRSTGEVEQANGWIIRIRDILGELLDGVRDKSNPVSQQVTDLYIFMLKLVGQVETSHDPQGLNQLREILKIECETWQEVVRKFHAEEARGIGLSPVEENRPAHRPTPHRPILEMPESLSELNLEV